MTNCLRWKLQELNEADFDLSLTGFDPGEIDALLVAPEDDERANAPPLPKNAVSRVGDLWLVDHTGCCVVMRSARKLWPDC
jgi:hypothetical protein